MEILPWNNTKTANEFRSLMDCFMVLRHNVEISNSMLLKAAAWL